MSVTWTDTTSGSGLKTGTGAPWSNLTYPFTVVWYTKLITDAAHAQWGFGDGTTEHLAGPWNSTNDEFRIERDTTTQGVDDYPRNGFTFDTTTWHAMILVVNAADDVTLYVDDDAGSNRTVSRDVLENKATSYFTIGNDSGLGGAETGTRAYIAEVAVFNHALGTSERTAYETKTPDNLGGTAPVAYWSLEHGGIAEVGSGATGLTDQQGNVSYSSEHPSLTRPDSTIYFGEPTKDGAVSGSHASDTMSHDNGGAGMMLLFVSANNDTSTAVDITVTYDGVSMTEIDAVSNSLALQPSSAIFVIEGSWSGAKTISLTFTNTANSWSAEAIPVYGYKAGESSWTTQTEVGSVSTRTRTITTVADNSSVVGFYAWRDPVNTLPLSKDDSDLWVGDDGGYSFGVGDGNAGICIGIVREVQPTAGSTSVNMSASEADRHASIAFELKAEVAAGATQTGSLINKIESGYGPLEGAGMNGRLQR